MESFKKSIKVLIGITEKHRSWPSNFSISGKPFLK